ncbi:hypothetical protein EDB87DRAFT_1573818 [Lactarius vividus]|nr:hypothetical protein EDB87DRAFT_1573818 [Lactarius vividus]
MRFACGSFLPLLLLLLTRTSVSGSGCDAGTVVPSGQLNNASVILSDAICPLPCLDGSSGGSDSQQDGPLSTVMAAPVPVLAVGLVALLWVWVVLDGALLLPVRARGQPLHDVGARGASAKMALSGWSSPGDSPIYSEISAPYVRITQENNDGISESGSESGKQGRVCNAVKE